MNSAQQQLKRWIWVFTLIYFIPTIFCLWYQLFDMDITLIDGINPLFIFYYWSLFTMIFYMNIKDARMSTSFKGKDHAIAIGLGVCMAILSYMSTYWSTDNEGNGSANSATQYWFFISLAIYVPTLIFFIALNTMIYTRWCLHHSDLAINRRIGFKLLWKSVQRSNKIMTNVDIELTKFKHRTIYFTHTAVYVFDYVSPELANEENEYNFGIKLTEEDHKKTKGVRKSDEKGQSQNVISLKNDCAFLENWFEGANEIANGKLGLPKVFPVIVYDKEENKPYFKGQNHGFLIGNVKEISNVIGAFESGLESTYNKREAVKAVERNRF